MEDRRLASAIGYRFTWAMGILKKHGNLPFAMGGQSVL